MSHNFPLTLASLALASIPFAGCNQASSPPATTKVADHDHDHSHDGWWCSEHGVPEGICALCNTKLVADFKAKGDWCEDHQRPDSQCFIHHPEKQTEFAAQYEAKYGKQPPKLGTPHDHAHDEKK